MEIQTQDKEDDQEGSEKKLEIPSELPILALYDLVVYPLTMIPINVTQPNLIQLVNDVVVSPSRIVGLVTIKDKSKTLAAPNDIYSTGTAATILRLLNMPDDSVKVIVQGIDRIHIKEFTATIPYSKARIERATEHIVNTDEAEALRRNTIALLRTLASLSANLPEDLLIAALNVENYRQLAYLVAMRIKMDLNEAQNLLELDTVEEKLRKINNILTKEVEILELGKKIQSEVQSEMDKTERYYFLRRQMKQIQKELGEEDEQSEEIRDYENKIIEAQMPFEAEKEAKRELSRMESMSPSAAEYNVIKTYLDWLVELPWKKTTVDNLDIVRAREILDEDHYDLKEIKERILEYLAVRKLRLERDQTDDPLSYKGPILCFVGPPGVGKTSLGQSIARALGRKFIRMSFGGLRDEAEIRGHRRTYLGAMPGRIIQAVKRVESHNPVIMLDEVDKIGSDFHGDPSSALLEVLDPAQNRTFFDYYLDLDFDLSQIIFICTANQLDPIQPALRDRMEIIRLPGYTGDEKLAIANHYIVPRQIFENGLKSEEIIFNDDVILQIVNEYTREAGVRNLEREIGSICRKVATLIAENHTKLIKITKDKVIEFLGKPKFYSEIAERTTIPGVATGLAVTIAGGDILFIEATKMPGSKGFTVTGQLGDVMKESAQAALSYVRSKARELGIKVDAFKNYDIHLHVPEGATPKDGPSAGVAIATALASLMTNRLVKNDIGMTGEITLRGRVLPVGGIKEKILAAHRAGLKKVIIPKRNEKDLDDLPEEIRKKIGFILAQDVSQVFDAALGELVHNKP